MILALATLALADGTDTCVDCPTHACSYSRTADEALQTDYELADTILRQQAEIQSLKAKKKASTSSTSTPATPATAPAAPSAVDLLTTESLLSEIKVNTDELVRKAREGSLTDSDRELMQSYSLSLAKIVDLLRRDSAKQDEQTALLTEIRDLLRDLHSPSTDATPLPDTNTAPSESSDKRYVQGGIGVALGVDGMDPKDRDMFLVSGNLVGALAWHNSRDGAAIIATLGLGNGGASLGSVSAVYYGLMGDVALGAGLYGDFQCYEFAMAGGACLGNSKSVGLSGLVNLDLGPASLGIIPHFSVGQHEPLGGTPGIDWRGGVLVPLMFWP